VAWSSNLWAEILEDIGSFGPRRVERIDRTFRRSGKVGGKPWRNGEENRNAVLTEKDVKAIKKSGCSHEWLAREYGVSVWNILAIVHGKTWRHVETDGPRQMNLIEVEDDEHGS